MSELKRVYLIDDDTDEHYLFKSALLEVRQTIECLMFDESTAALNYLGKHHPSPADLIVLDLNMPLMNGKEWLANIKKMIGDKLPPVMIQSNSTAENDIADSQKLGARFYLPKRSFTETISGLKAVVALLENGTPLPATCKILQLDKPAGN
jgi:CheY-like chemotaxis protein